MDICIFGYETLTADPHVRMDVQDCTRDLISLDGVYQPVQRDYEFEGWKRDQRHLQRTYWECTHQFRGHKSSKRDRREF